jgi:hypothetical protein
MSLATLAGSAVSSAGIAWPAWGLWWADVHLTEAVELEGSQTLAVAGVEFTGTVIAGGVLEGRASYRMVAGAGGVAKPLTSKGYVNDAGVMLATVLADAAREAGEALDTAGLVTRLGPHYARREGDTLGDLLQRHFPGGWYADTDGTIKIGTRSSTTYDGSAPRVRVGVRVIELAVDSLDGLAPGVRVDDQGPATDLQIDLTPKRLTVKVYAAQLLTRRLRAFQRITRAMFPALTYAGAWEYRVISASGGRANLQPVRVGSGMPNLRNVVIRQGVYGLIDTIPPGELVLVVFADNDPSRPQVITRGSSTDPTWIPTLLALPVALGTPVPAPSNVLKAI